MRTIMRKIIRTITIQRTGTRTRTRTRVIIISDDV